MTPETSDYRAIASSQRIVLISLVLNAVLLLISILTLNTSPGILQTLLGFGYLIVTAMSLYGAYKLATELGFSTPRVVLALLLMFVPGANIITLAVLHHRATNVLRGVEAPASAPTVHAAPLP